MSYEATRKPLFEERRFILAGFGFSALAALIVYLAVTRDLLRLSQALLINWIFWTGMAQGGVVFSAIIELTDSSWGRPMKRIGECFAMFLPVSLMLFILAWPTWAPMYPWVNDPVPGLGWWLRPWFVYLRDAAALFVMCMLSLAYVYYSVRPDFGAAKGFVQEAYWRKALTAKWRGDEVEIEIGASRRKTLAVALIIAYGLVYSLLAFDLIMSLSPSWYSTLFGAYVFVVNMFGALAMVAVVSILLRKNVALSGAIGEPQFHDLGKLLLAFCLLSLDFFWSQFLVIWYGNLPEETEFVILRAYEYPWKFFGWAALFGGFVLPFIVLISRRVKANPVSLFAVSIWILAMVWIERFTLIAPSVWDRHTIPLGVPEIAATAFFGTLFVSSFVWMFDRVPALPVTDPVFTGKKAPHHVIGELDLRGE